MNAPEPCPSCTLNAPRHCLSHTCPDCGGHSADVEAHRC